MADYPTIAISELKPYENNARMHPPEQIEKIANSIKEFGFITPVIVDENNMILVGHGRTEAAKACGMISVPFRRITNLTDEQKRAYILADNKLSDIAEWDEELLQAELDRIELDMTQFGFEEFDINIDEDAGIIEDIPPEPQQEARTKPGEIYRLGNHRLICGDSTEPETVRKLLDGAEIDLLLTDPPYNVNVGTCERPNSKNDGVAILNDNMDADTFIRFLTSALGNAAEHMKPGGAFYIFYAGLHHTEFETAINNVEPFYIHEQLVWVKSHFVMGRNSDYQWMHEPIIYGWKKGAEHFFTDSRSEGTVFEDVKLSTMSKGDLISLVQRLRGDTVSTTVIRDDKPSSAELHPTIKPQKMLTKMLRNSSRQGENVLDLFGGSGSTLIACEQTNRKCYMIELDPHYCDVIIDRWEEMTGKRAERIEGWSQKEI